MGLSVSTDELVGRWGWKFLYMDGELMVPYSQLFGGLVAAVWKLLNYLGSVSEYCLLMVADHPASLYKSDLKVAFVFM